MVKCAIDVSFLSSEDKRFPRIFVKAGLSGIAIDLSRWARFEEPIKGAVPGYRGRQQIYRKTETFFHLCAQYGVRSALKKVGKQLLGQKDKTGQGYPAGSSMAKAVRKLAELYAQNSLQTVLMHSPFLQPAKQDVELNSQLVKFAQESIRICAAAACHTLVVRPLATGIDKGSEWEANREFFNRLLPQARKHDLTLLLENQMRDYNGRLVRGILSDPNEAVRWIDKLNKEAQAEAFGMCLDLDALDQGRQNVGEYVQCLGSHLQAVRCKFTLDARYYYRELILALRKIRFNGVLAFDSRAFLRGVPDSLLPATLELMADTVNYLQMQVALEQTLRKYSKLVLFGTGQMFRNYMTNYGQVYPPLFACDNAREKWNTEVCGVPILPPEKLRDLPDDCGVFICNRFYGEIAKQLAQMGVKNVERFNDEVLPVKA